MNTGRAVDVFEYLCEFREGRMRWVYIDKTPVKAIKFTGKFLAFSSMYEELGDNNVGQYPVMIVEAPDGMIDFYPLQMVGFKM